MHNTITIEIPRPNTVEDLETVRQEASDRAYAQAVFDLVRRGIVSSGYGAQLLGIDTGAMLERMRRYGIPVTDYSAAILLEEVEDALRDFDSDDQRLD